MGLVISVSGIGNCGKSTLINGQEGVVGIREALENEGKTVLVLGEVARELLETMNPADDMALFQERISSKEYIRAYHLLKQKDLYDVILVDRTYMDNLAYFAFNVVQGKINGQTRISTPDVDPYDSILFFDTPIKETGTEAFTHYNDDLLNQMMGSYVKNRFKEKVVLFQNGMIDREKIFTYVSKLTGTDIKQYI